MIGRPPRSTLFPYTTLFRSGQACAGRIPRQAFTGSCAQRGATRSEEHTSELQSPCNLVCRLLLEKTDVDARTHADPVSETFFLGVRRSDGIDLDSARAQLSEAVERFLRDCFF